MVAAAGSRDVVFNLKAQIAPETASAFRQMADSGRQAQRDINRSAEQGSKDRQRFVEEEASRAKQLNRQSVREEQQAQQERSRLIEKGRQDRIRAEQDASKASQKAMQDSERASSQYNQSLVRMAASRHGLLLGSMHVARGVASLLSSNEKQAQKLMQNLMVVQGAYDVLRGSTHIIEGLRTAYETYTAAVTAAAVAERASAVAANESAAAHAKDAIAAEADAVANRNLAAAQGGRSIGGMGGMVGRGLSLGGRGLAAIGGGSVGTGAAMVGIPLVAAAAFYKGATMGPEHAAAAAERNTGIREAAYAGWQQSTAAGEHRGDSIEQIETQRREARSQIERGAFARSMSREERLRALSAPKISEQMQDWSASRGEIGRREPGAAGYDSVEKSIHADRAAGEGIISKYQADANRAARDVATKREEQATAEADEKQWRGASVMAQAKSAEAQQRLEGDNNAWMTGTNWIRNSGRWLGGSTANQQLQDHAENAKQGAMGLAETAGERESTVKAAAAATENALKEQQKTVEKIATEKEAQAQRDMQNAEQYITKLKEMYNAHLRNADAIEKSGRALTVQLALENPRERRTLMQAMQHQKAGKASDIELGELARHASPEKAEQFEKEIERRHPEYGNLREFLGKGQSAVNAEKAKAADEHKRIKQQEGYLGQARENAVKAADVMTDKLAGILKELFDAQEQRFTKALDRIKSDVLSGSHSGRANSG